MNFKPNKHELYLFNREIEKEGENRQRREREKSEKEREFCINFNVNGLLED